MEDQIVNNAVESEVSTQPDRSEAIKNNLISMRLKLEKEEEARKAAERKAQELESRMAQYQPLVNNQSTTEEDDLGVDPEDYLQAKQYTTANKKIKSKQKQHEEEINQLKERIAIFEAKTEIDSIKDFNEVVNTENLKTLARLYPEDYEIMNTYPDLRKKAKSAYNMIKRYGIIDYQIDQAEERMEKNKKKPGNASTGQPQQPQTPLSRIGEYDRRVLSESDRDRILRKVEEIKSRG